MTRHALHFKERAVRCVARRRVVSGDVGRRRATSDGGARAEPPERLILSNALFTIFIRQSTKVRRAELFDHTDQTRANLFPNTRLLSFQIFYYVVATALRWKRVDRLFIFSTHTMRAR